ncbi:MAG TPA: hypothetical protein VFE58_14525 [Tepidisphaeraceae bacterium]|jgi:hypothetical protein|nr:hypothetical protein [Tepidisphaeraceae bacterium]
MMSDLKPHGLEYSSGAGAVPQGFTPEHLVEIAEAKKRFVRIRREISVAVFDAWSVAIFAGITVVCSLGSISGMFVGFGMGVIAFVEFRSIARLRQLDPDAPHALGRNQLVFATVLILYAAYNLLFPGAGLSAEIKDAAGADPELASTLAGVSDMVNHILYAGVIAFALVFQGGCAIYHYTRTRYLKQYLQETPEWIRKLHSAGLMN